MATTEHLDATVRAYGKDCIGCKTHNADVMISGKAGCCGEVHDFFISRENAQVLLGELQRALQKGGE